MNQTRNQHIVPQFILEKFCFNNKRQVYAYDKIRDNSFPVNIRNVASGRDFYTVKFQGEDLSLEESLTNIESKCAPIIAQIIKDKSLKSITHERMICIDYFVALQLVRTRKLQDMMRVFDQEIQDLIIKMGGDPNKSNNYSPLKEENLKALTFQQILKMLPQYTEMMSSKHMVLYETTEEIPFITSDAPVTLHNDNDYGPRSGLGLMVRGIQIYFPISTTLCIGYHCDSIYQSFKKSYEQTVYMLNTDPWTLKHLAPGPSRFFEIYHAYTQGSTIKMDQENVNLQNYLQLFHSSQQIYSKTDNFEFVQLAKENGDL